MIDRFIIEFDKALRTVFAEAQSQRVMPGSNSPTAQMTPTEQRHVGALMRINHSGEICAQALYQGQAILCKNPTIKAALQKASQEETEHLAWTQARIKALGTHKSFLNPVWYAGSLAIGLGAGLLGDGWNLGFLQETEQQVERHLDKHLAQIPSEDAQSKAVLAQMREDEISHAKTASELGAHKLPTFVKLGMRLSAKVMTQTAYYL